MMPREAVLPLALFVALVLCTALSALAASGHFPRRHRNPSLRCGLGRAILFGACGLAAVALMIGGAAAWRLMPWPAAVIGAGQRSWLRRWCCVHCPTASSMGAPACSPSPVPQCCSRSRSPP